jgi:hypothetical protein
VNRDNLYLSIPDTKEAPDHRSDLDRQGRPRCAGGDGAAAPFRRRRKAQAELAATKKGYPFLENSQPSGDKKQIFGNEKQIFWREESSILL